MCTHRPGPFQTVQQRTASWLPSTPRQWLTIQRMLLLATATHCLHLQTETPSPAAEELEPHCLRATSSPVPRQSMCTHRRGPFRTVQQRTASWLPSTPHQWLTTHRTLPLATAIPCLP